MADLMEALTGTWQGEGRGQYPTIDPFPYREEVILTPLPGKPILSYTQRTHTGDGRALHAEAGYYRFGAPLVELVIAQPTGIAEIHRGTVTHHRLEFEQTGILLTPSAVEVKEVRRVIDVEDDVLTYRLDMSAVGQPLLLHLEARLFRTGPT